jgi:uncharacterized OsmC-like protein
MKITAIIENSFQKNNIWVSTEDQEKSISIAGKSNGMGSSVNGGELLFLALATCFCNDIYREAAKRNLNIQSVKVTVTGNFGMEGEPATNINYIAEIQSPDSDSEIKSLIRYVDSIAEIHNTLRKGVNVTLSNT